MKTCTKCKISKSLDNYSRGSRYKDGLQTICKACRRDKYLATKESEQLRAKLYNLTHKQQRSDYNRKFASTEHGRYTRYKGKAKERGLSFNLNLDQFTDLIQSDCTYCSDKGGGIDRIDSSIGYELFNCLPCCFQCNSMKLDFSLGEFLEKVKRICIQHS